MKKIISFKENPAPIKILVFEDYKGMIDAYKMFNESCDDVEITILECGEDIKQFTREELNSFQYIFCDYQLKESVNGGQLVKYLNHVRYKGFVLACSSEPHYNELMIASGADDACDKLDVFNLLKDIVYG